MTHITFDPRAAVLLRSQARARTVEAVRAGLTAKDLGAGFALAVFILTLLGLAS